jgi:hypothetical protein
LTPNQHYLLYCCKNNIKTTLIHNSLQDVTLLKASGLLLENNNITEKAEKILDSLSGIFRKTQSKLAIDIMGSDFMMYMSEYRNYFPNTKRASPAEIKTKFSKLFLENPGLKWENLIKATKLYFSEDRDEKYIYKASNFIMVQRGGINTYPILEYYERIIDGEEIKTSSDVNMYKIY